MREMKTYSAFKNFLMTHTIPLSLDHALSLDHTSIRTSIWNNCPQLARKTLPILLWSTTLLSSYYPTHSVRHYRIVLCWPSHPSLIYACWNHFLYPAYNYWLQYIPLRFHIPSGGIILREHKTLTPIPISNWYYIIRDHRELLRSSIASNIYEYASMF